MAVSGNSKLKLFGFIFYSNIELNKVKLVKFYEILKPIL